MSLRLCTTITLEFIPVGHWQRVDKTHHGDSERLNTDLGMVISSRDRRDGNTASCNVR